MKTLLFIYPNQFGYHTDSYKYCEYLKDSYEITYYCFDQNLEKISISGVKVIYMPFNTGKIKRLFDYFRCIIRDTQKKEYDIIFTIQFKFSFLIGLFAKGKTKILDYRTGDLSENNIIRKVKNFFMFFDSLFYKHISVISDGLRGELGIKNYGTVILPLGGDVFSGKKHDYTDLNLLYVGSFNQRNIHQTVEGLALFLKRNKEHYYSISYTIVGFGNKEDTDKIKMAIVENDLSAIVSLEGRKRYTELAEYFDKCNIGVSYVPRTPWYEYQPVTKTFEYLISGLFTIATDTFENRKVITSGNGILCKDTPLNFAEALGQVINLKESIDEKEVRSSVKDYEWHSIVRKILEPYLMSVKKDKPEMTSN